MTVLQSAIGLANVYTHLPSARMHFPVEGTVIRVHWPKDRTNRSGSEIEYDIVPNMIGLGRICNAPLALGVHGITDDDEVVLRPAQLVIPTGNFNTSTLGSGRNTDGDRVLVQFVNGSLFAPVITHVLTHPARNRRDGAMVPKYRNKTELLAQGPGGTTGTGYAFGTGSNGSTKIDLDPAIGERTRHLSINGTHVAIDRNGDVFINCKAHPDDTKGLMAGNVAKKVVVQNEGNDLLRIEKTPSGLQVTVCAGLASQVQSAALGEPLKTLYNSLKAKLDAADGHVHPTSFGASGPPTPIVSAPSWDDTIVSTKLKVGSNT